MSQLIKMMKETGDFVLLDNTDDYADYFNHLSRVCRTLIMWYKHLIEAGKGGETEERLLTGFLEKMLFTIQMWRLKRLYNPSHNLALDLNESGFPHTLAIMEFEADLLAQAEKIQKLTPKSILIKQMLNEMLEWKREPTEHLWEMANHEYFNSISKDKLLLTFTPGELELVVLKPEQGHRKYRFSWACYDFKTNMPYFHLMDFDYDIEEEELEAKGSAYDQFLEVIKAEGSRASTVGVLASSIDEKLRPVHPKILKRVRIGPVISPSYSREENPEPMNKFLSEYGEPGDFAIKLLNEIIFSSRQVEQPRKLFDFKRTKRVRQVFAIPESDLTCFERQATKVYEHIIMPHKVLQQVIDDPLFATYAKMEKIVYNKEGALYVV